MRRITTQELGAALHEALLEGWAFSTLDRVTLDPAAPFDAICGDRMIELKTYGFDGPGCSSRYLERVPTKELFVIRPAAPVHGYGGYATDPYAPGARRGRRS